MTIDDFAVQFPNEQAGHDYGDVEITVNEIAGVMTENLSVTLVVDNGTEQFSGTQSPADIQGDSTTLTFSVGVIEDADDYTATVTADADNAESVTAVTTFTVSAAQPDTVDVVNQPRDATAGEVIESDSHPSVRVTDEFDNPVANQTVEVGLEVNEGTYDLFPGTGTTEVNTDENGIASFNDLILTEAGTYRLLFRLVDDTSISTSSAEFTVDAATIVEVVIEPAPTAEVLPDEDLIFTAEAKDAFGNVASDDVTDFTWVNAVDGVFNQSGGGFYDVTAALDGVTSAPTVVRVGVNINTADVVALQLIIHIGPVRAQQIITLREEEEFCCLDDLVRVTGINGAGVLLQAIKDQGFAYVD